MHHTDHAFIASSDLTCLFELIRQVYKSCSTLKNGRTPSVSLTVAKRNLKRFSIDASLLTESVPVLTAVLQKKTSIVSLLSIQQLFTLVFMPKACLFCSPLGIGLSLSNGCQTNSTFPKHHHLFFLIGTPKGVVLGQKLKYTPLGVSRT